jgi:1-acyl-sn-glycerol-3-phosphate acyltransferase
VRRVPQLGDAVPQRRNRIMRGIALALCRLLGWRLDGALPNVPRAVVIGAPHTANFDGIIGILLMMAMGLKSNTFIKDSAFIGPLGWLLRAVGALPIRRGVGAGMVEQSVATLKAAEQMWVVIAPEGTRHAADQWKLGFHHIAHGAGIPIVPAVIHYGDKCVRVLPPRLAGDDAAADLAALLDEIAAVSGPRHPSRTSKLLRDAMERHRSGSA